MVQYLTAILLLVGMLLQCDSSNSEVDCSVMNGDGVELIYPRGTETFTVGSTVPIKWKVDPDKVSQIRVTISTNTADGPFKNIYTQGIDVDYDNGVQCGDTLWTIGSEDGAAIQYTSAQTVYIRVESYTDSHYQDASEMITINNR